MPSRDHRHPWRTYLAVSAPGWLMAAVLAVALYRLTEFPAWAAFLLVALWIVTDLAMFPWVRQYYSSPEPAARRMVGEHGVAVSDLSPRGFVRVHGELWQAELTGGASSLRDGSPIRVREIQGLELFVEPARADGTPIVR